MPLSRIARPTWDKQVLGQFSPNQMLVEEEVWKEVWSEEEKANYQSTPMFLIIVEK